MILINHILFTCYNWYLAKWSSNIWHCLNFCLTFIFAVQTFWRKKTETKFLPSKEVWLDFALFFLCFSFAFSKLRGDKTSEGFCQTIFWCWLLMNSFNLSQSPKPLALDSPNKWLHWLLFPGVGSANFGTFY